MKRTSEQLFNAQLSYSLALYSWPENIYVKMPNTRNTHTSRKLIKSETITQFYKLQKRVLVFDSRILAF